MKYEILIKDFIIPSATILVSILVAYLTSWYSFRIQYNLGKYQLLEIVNRYYITYYGTIDFQKSPHITKTGVNEKIYVISELKKIQSDISGLINNPFYVKLIKVYPEISMINVVLTRAIVDLEKSKSILYNRQLFEHFSKLHKRIYSTIPKKIKKQSTYKEIEQIVIDFNTSIKNTQLNNFVIK